MFDITHRIYLGSEEVGRVEKLPQEMYLVVSYGKTPLQYELLANKLCSYCGDGEYSYRASDFAECLNSIPTKYNIIHVEDCKAYLQSLQTDDTLPLEPTCKAHNPKSILTHWLYDADKQVGLIHYTEEQVFLVSWLNDIGLNDLNRYRDIKLKDVNELTLWLMRRDTPNAVSTTDYPVLRDGLELGLQPDFEQFEVTPVPVQHGKHSDINFACRFTVPDFKIYKDDVFVGAVELGYGMNQIYLNDERAITLLQSNGYEDFIVEDNWVQFDTLYFRNALQLLNANGFTVSEWLNALNEFEPSGAVDNSPIDTNNSVYSEIVNDVAELERSDALEKRLETVIDHLKILPSWALNNIISSLNDELQYREDVKYTTLETIAADSHVITPSSTCEL